MKQSPPARRRCRCLLQRRRRKPAQREKGKGERGKRKVKMVGFDSTSSVSHEHMETAEAGHSMFGFVGFEVVGVLPLETPRVVKNAKMGQTNVPFNTSSIGGFIESNSLPDAEEQAQQAINQEAPRRGNQASEEADETRRNGGQSGRAKKKGPRSCFSARTGKHIAPAARVHVCHRSPAVASQGFCACTQQVDFAVAKLKN